MQFHLQRLRFALLFPIVLFAGAHAPGADVTLRSGIDKANFDSAVKPGDDFYAYVNGAWNKSNPIPPEYSRWGAFFKLRDDNLLTLRKLIEDLDDPAAKLDDNGRKLRDFYRTAMDEPRLQRAGTEPLDDELKRIAAVSDTGQLVAEIGRLHAEGVSSLFGFSVHQDEKQSTRYAVHLHQGGLGLPERDYYLGTTDDSKRIRGQYQQHVAKMLELLGEKPAAAAEHAATVLKIETKLAERCRTPVQQRDREAQYNRRTLAELAALTPNLKWDAYWKRVGVANISGVIVGQPEFFERVDELLATVPIDQWRVYVRWHLLSSTASCLSDPLVHENFHFYSEVLRGSKQIQPRWKRAIGAVDGYLGEALGKLYVEKYFPPTSKQRMDAPREERHGRLSPADRIARLDGAGNQAASPGEAGGDHAEDRSPRDLARLFNALDRQRFVCAKRAPGE